VLRPRFLTVGQYQLLQHAIREVMPTFAKAYQEALVNPSFRAQFHLTEWEEELMQVNPGFSAPSPTARMDTFFTSGSTQDGMASQQELFFAEYNAETPAAAAYNDSLSEVFLALPVMGAFQRRYEIRPLPGRHHLLHALLDSFRQWAGATGRASPSWIGAKCPLTASSCCLPSTSPRRISSV